MSFIAFIMFQHLKSRPSIRSVIVNDNPAFQTSMPLTHLIMIADVIEHIEHDVYEALRMCTYVGVSYYGSDA